MADNRTHDDEGYGPGENPKYNRTLVQLSAEATAAWFGGENIQWTDHLVDPEMRRALAQQQEAIRGVIDEACRQGLHPQSDKFLDMLVGALQAGSQQTAQRLQGLREQGDQRLLMAMVLELFDFAHGQQGRERTDAHSSAEAIEAANRISLSATGMPWRKPDQTPREARRAKRRERRRQDGHGTHLPGQSDEDY